MLKYMPIYGSILLTIIIVWIIASTIVGNRRKIRDAAAGRYIRSACCSATTTPLGWSQDGWISQCDVCGTWQYLGDDFDNPPPGFEDRHTNAKSLNVILNVRDDATPAMLRARDHFRDLEAQLIPNSRRPAPRSAASAERRQSDEAKSADALGKSTEVTSGCELCGGVLDHEPDCPKGILIDLLPDQDSPIPTPDDLPPPPNVGGEGHPDYQGPHYAVDHDRFVPYDVLRDPPEGAAVHIVGNVACVGPLEVEQGDRGDVNSIREEDES